uniref:Uncharacterized protein n=1 Tax=Arundo donax TaxID=35708 RepID=A0A0A8YKT6_ARUDO
MTLICSSIQSCRIYRICCHSKSRKSLQQLLQNLKMTLLRGDVERIEAVVGLDPRRLHVGDLQDLAHDLGVALLGGDVQRRLAVLVLPGRHLRDQRPVELGEDLLGVGHAPGPRREVERRVASLARAVPAPPLQGHHPEALLLLHPPEALQLLQRAQPEAGLPLHGRIQKATRWNREMTSDCDALFLQNPGKTSPHQTL